MHTLTETPFKTSSMEDQEFTLGHVYYDTEQDPKRERLLEKYKWFKKETQNDAYWYTFNDEDMRLLRHLFKIETKSMVAGMVCYLTEEEMENATKNVVRNEE